MAVESREGASGADALSHEYILGSERKSLKWSDGKMSGRNEHRNGTLREG